jgi:hypothetical protein
LANPGNASLLGVVRDAATQQPVADAVITLTSPNLQGEEFAVTDASGGYLFPSLPPGRYLLWIQVDSYKPYMREGLDLHADSTVRLNAALLPEALKAQEVVVVGRTPTVDIGSSSTGLNITADFTSRVPLSAPGVKGSAARSFESVAEVAPGAQYDAFGVSIFGSSSPENRYLLDGMSVSNSTYGVLGTPLSIEFIKEVSVLSGGYMPEYGRATGGIINAITKSGSNEYHGNVFMNVAPGALAGHAQQVQREAQTVRTLPTLGLMADIGGDVGGPLIRDKLWFYAGFDVSQTRYDLRRSLYRTLLDDAGEPQVDDAGNSQTEYIPGSSKTEAAQQTMFQAIGKLTWAATKHQRVTLSLNGVYPLGADSKYGINPATGSPEIGTESIPYYQGTLSGQYSALAHRYPGNSTNVMAKWSAELDGQRAMLDTWLGYHHETGGRLPSDGSSIGSSSGLAGQSNVWWTAPHNLTVFEKVPNGACDAPDGSPNAMPCPVSDYRTGGPEFVDQQTTHRVQARSIFTYLINALGRHTFKAGVDFEHQNHNSTRGYTGVRDFWEFSDGTLAQQQGYGYLTGPDQAVWLDSISNQTRSLSLGAFLQDSWIIADRVTVNLGLRYDAQLLYGNDSNLAMTLPNQWSPRVGVIVDPLADGRMKIYGNYARYFENVPLRMLDRYLSGEPLLFAGTDPSKCDLLDQGQLRDQCLTGDAVVPYGSPPNSQYDQYSAGTSLVDPKLKAPSTDEVVAGFDFEVMRNARLGISYTKRWLNNTIEDMSRDEGHTFFFGNPGHGIAKDFPKAVRKYDGVTLQFTKLFGDGWLSQASYTVSWLRGNYGGLYRADDLQFDPHQSSDFDLRSLITNRYGPLPGDHRHYIKLFGAKELKLPGRYGVITPGAAFRAFSGNPSNYLGTHPIYGPDQVYILPRGEGERLPWNFNFDARLAYGFELAKGRSISFTVDVFNLFNFQGVTARDQRYTSTAVNPVTAGGLDALQSADGSEVVVNPNFGRTTQYQAPRVFRFGLKGSF